METKVKLIDVADELLILNKHTVDKLYTLDNSADCIALYVFYYKTAKWQKTDTIKANDKYIKSSLGWGIDRIHRTKSALKENGLIDIVQRRENGKISGWYITVSYLVTHRNLDDIKIIVESKNTQNQQVEKSTSGFQDTNALKINNKCLNNNISIKRKNTKKKSDEIINTFLARITDDDLREAYQAFIEMRAEIKAPITTERMLNILRNKLEKITHDTQKQVDLLNEAIFNKWKSVYITTDKNASKGKITSDFGAYDLELFEEKLNEG